MFKLVILAILLLPFNGLPIYFFGSISQEGAFYPLFFLVLAVSSRQLINGSILIIDKSSFRIAMLICLFSLVSFILNSDQISSAYHMERYGLNRFIEQFFQLILGFLIAYSIAYTVDTEIKLHFLIKVIVGMMAAYALFGLFQYFAYSFGGALNDLHSIVGNFIFHSGATDKMILQGGRVHSVSQEPALMGMLIAVMGPYVIYYSIATKRYWHIILMTIILILSYSRTGYVVYFALCTILIFLYIYKFLNFKRVIFFTPLAFLFLLALFLSPFLDVYISLLDFEENTSNAARYAGAFSAILLWQDSNILLGVGLGQLGFHTLDYIPIWGNISGEIQDVVNGERWPFVHNLLVKILVETGIIGAALWIIFYINIILKLNRINWYNSSLQNIDSKIGYAVFVSVVGSFLIMFNRELLSNMNIWVSLGIALSYIRIHTLQNFLESKT